MLGLFVLAHAKSTGQQTKPASLRPDRKTKGDAPVAGTPSLHRGPESNDEDDDKENRGEEGSEDAEGEELEGQQQQ